MRGLILCDGDGRRMGADNYWHSLCPVPDKVKSELKAMVFGEVVTRLQLHCQIQMDFLKVSGTLFKNIFAINRQYLYMGDYTAPPDENDYDSCDCFVTENGLAGFAITKNGWLVSLFSNWGMKGFLKSSSLVIKEKAIKLVCIVSGNYLESRLIKTYKDVLGFVPYAKTINDAQIMGEYYGSYFVKNFQKCYGEPYHLFMVKPDYMGEKTELYVFDDYFEAQRFVDLSVR